MSPTAKVCKQFLEDFDRGFTRGIDWIFDHSGVIWLVVVLVLLAHAVG